ncbi:hypothetical protein MGYG_02873 [Nannizzia gypsea CBS 118893]|uniref:Protein kinase domain-containing protein n=1 Tax=Arthroderma gypseum (strain ATCC MYA-4604 / CBS 118893) TaxID=535722 RepID=E4UPI6_ARTGP|nr:hypothetical protein MGYG_02873 [Nannizzia gypsea CBS 118893]EFQ99861.1 hypothetical protein MGYG_02873 [Nannizzia gypsea CBS 118893]
MVTSGSGKRTVLFKLHLEGDIECSGLRMKELDRHSSVDSSYLYQDRYEIVHKLGAGSYSTIRLAKDRQDNVLVAINIIVSQYPKSRVDTENKTLQLLALGPKDYPRRAYDFDGPVPARWSNGWGKMSFFFNDYGSWKDNDRCGLVLRLLRERILNMMDKGEFHTEELPGTEKLLEGMLAYEPSQRISAKDAVGSEWINKLYRNYI